MFEISFWLMIQNLLVNIFLPLIPGIIFLWIFYNDKFKGILLYILSWFIWVGVVAFAIFNLQFVYYGIWIKEYFIILWLLIIWFIIKIFYQKLSIQKYIRTLKIKNIYPDIKYSFWSLSKIEKKFTIIISIFVGLFMINTFIFNISFPTYWDDSFGNRNTPAYNIYQDEWIKFFGEKNEILWRWRLGYPIYISIYKAVISDFVGFNDIYINIWQWFIFLGLLLFVFNITFQKTKNIFYSLIPLWLIISLPLVFFHAVEWYMELASAAYSIIAIWAFLNYLEKRDYPYISIGLLSLFILSYIKNDWFIVYLPGILMSLFIVLVWQKDFKEQILWFFKKWYNWLISVLYFLFFFLPFLIIKNYYNLWFNQAAWSESGVWISKTIHREIFSTFKNIFLQMDNYNTVFIILALIILIFIQTKKVMSPWKKFLIYAPLIILIILILVFLLTENYMFVLNQTTVNRVFTMVFVLLFGFSWYIFADKWNE